MKMLLCSFEGCQEKATGRCCCKYPELLFCAEHLGKHLIDSPGKHEYEKLFDDPYLQTKNDVLSYIQKEIQNSFNFKKKLIEEVYSEVFKINNSFDSYLRKIDEKIFSLDKNLNEIITALENKSNSTALEYLKLPSIEAITYFKENNKFLIDNFTHESIISEIYKNLGWVKNTEFQEISGKNVELELELLELRTDMNQLYQKSVKEVEEFKAKDLEQTKTIDSYVLTNNQLKLIYDELYKEKRDLEIRYNEIIQNNKSHDHQGLNLFTAMNKSENPQVNFFKQNPLGSASKSSSDIQKTSICTICKGSYPKSDIESKHCGCLFCKNCAFPEFEKLHGMFNAYSKKCRVCKKKKLKLTKIWS